MGGPPPKHSNTNCQSASLSLARGSGWESSRENIFLFLLPLWPLPIPEPLVQYLFCRARAPPHSALGKVIEEKRKRKRARLCLLSPHIPPFFVGGAWVFSPERRERERERERGREGEGERGNNPLPSRGATGEETKKRRKEKLTGQYIFPPSVLPFVLTYTKRRIFTAQGQDKR